LPPPHAWEIAKQIVAPAAKRDRGKTSGLGECLNYKLNAYFIVITDLASGKILIDLLIKFTTVILQIFSRRM